MRTLLVGALAMMVALTGVRPASADDGTCKELHCFCSWGEEVVSCDLDCDDVCYSPDPAQPSSSGGGNHKMSIIGGVVATLLLALLVASLWWSPDTSSTARSFPDDECAPSAPAGLSFHF